MFSNLYYLEMKSIEFLALQTVPDSLQNILKRNLELVTLLSRPDPELDPAPLGHDPGPDAVPGLEHGHAVGLEQETGVQSAVVEAEVGVDGVGDDVVVGVGDSEVAGAEDEGVGEGKGLGLRFGSQGSELDASEAAGFPVLAVGGDVDGEDGVGAEVGLEEGEEVGGYGGLGDV